MFLVADDPSRLQPMRQLFEVLEPLDQAYGIELPPLEVRETEPEPAAQAGGEAEAEGEALDQDALDALLNQAQGGADEARTGTG